MRHPSSREQDMADRLAFGHYARTGQRLSEQAVRGMVERKFNHNHDPDNGQFTFGPGGSAGASRAGLSNSVHSASNAGRVRSSVSSAASKPRQTASSAAQSSQPRTPEQRDKAQKLAGIVSSGEGNYDSYNTGTRGVKDGKVGHSYLNPPAGTVTGKTIDDIIGTESLSGNEPARLFAVGKYQITIPTLRDAKMALGLSGDEPFTPELQDKIFEDYLVPRAGNGALGRFVFSGTGSVDAAQFAASQKWASIGVPRGLKR